MMQPEPPQTVAQAVECLLANLAAEERPRLRCLRAAEPMTVFAGRVWDKLHGLSRSRSPNDRGGFAITGH